MSSRCRQAGSISLSRAHLRMVRLRVRELGYLSTTCSPMLDPGAFNSLTLLTCLHQAKHPPEASQCSSPERCTGHGCVQGLLASHLRDRPERCRSGTNSICHGHIGSRQLKIHVPLKAGLVLLYHAEQHNILFGGKRISSPT